MYCLKWKLVVTSASSAACSSCVVALCGHGELMCIRRPCHNSANLFMIRNTVRYRQIIRRHRRTRTPSIAARHRRKGSKMVPLRQGHWQTSADVQELNMYSQSLIHVRRVSSIRCAGAAWWLSRISNGRSTVVVVVHHIAYHSYQRPTIRIHHRIT